MTGSSIGKIFKVSTWGESHGKAIGCTIDGVPSGIKVTESFIQRYLNKRKPGNSKFTSQRKEPDKVSILSGVFEGKTTGTPISLVIENVDKRSKDYSDIKDSFRPGHADWTYFSKFGVRDYRGGGRASARETAMRVAAGAIARKILGNSVKIKGALVQIGNKKIEHKNWNDSEIDKNDFFCPDKNTVEVWAKYLQNIRKQGSSIGALIEIKVSGVPAGLGEPIFDKIDALISHAIMSIPAVKGVEIGNGFECVAMRGEDNADEISSNKKNIKFKSNNSGGSLGGITSGQDITIRFAVKPTSSILKPKKTINKKYQNVSIITKGRHDPCVGIRAVPIGEAMIAIVLADCFLINKTRKS